MKLSDLENVKQGAVLVSGTGWEHEFLCIYREQAALYSLRSGMLSLWTNEKLKEFAIKQEGPLLLRPGQQGTFSNGVLATNNGKNNVYIGVTEDEIKQEPKKLFAFKDGGVDCQVRLYTKKNLKILDMQRASEYDIEYK